MSSRKLLPFLINFYGIIGVCIGIQIVNIWVPNQKCVGEDALLVCNYTLDDDKLYSAKWYKGIREFYRYKPTEANPKKIFPMSGIQVELEKSDDRYLYLTNLSHDSRGHYKCEVSAEYPTYQTVSATGLMSICILPQSAPTIKGGKAYYRLGDLVDVTCTSDESRPASNIEWFINGEKADKGYVLHHEPSALQSGTFISSSRLKFQVARMHFINEKLTIKCMSNVSTLYWKTQRNFTVIDNLVRNSGKESSAPVQQFISSPGDSITLGFNVPVVLSVGIWLCICSLL